MTRSSSPEDDPPKDPEDSLSWIEFTKTAKDKDIRSRFRTEIEGVIGDYPAITDKYCCAYILDPVGSIGKFEANSVFRRLTTENKDRQKDVLLVLLSQGGSIEPAYQISKICKQYSHQRFVVAVPREAKSAATLIAIGADEIHIGPLGQLGPIDPQLGGLPALGVAQALKTIAKLSNEYPRSADMFARYLHHTLTVEQIGYCERIAESAVQYAERLLLTKKSLSDKAQRVARELVYEYKHHGFVIDVGEAIEHLGSEWIKTATPEIEFAEKVYDHFDTVNLLLDVYANKRLMCVGDLASGVLVFDTRR